MLSCLKNQKKWRVLQLRKHTRELQNELSNKNELNSIVVNENNFLKQDLIESEMKYDNDDNLNNTDEINDKPAMENETTSNKNKDEEEMYYVKARAYKHTTPSSGWKDFGTGAIKLLHNKSTEKHQLLLQNEQSGKLIINISVVKGMKVKTNEKFIMLVAAMDETIGPESFIFEVGESNVDAFMKHLNDIVK